MYGLAICGPQFLSAIECRTVVGHHSPKSTGQDVECSLEKGLQCRGQCFDFEIRVLCDCGKFNNSHFLINENYTMIFLTGDMEKPTPATIRPTRTPQPKTTKSPIYIIMPVTEKPRQPKVGELCDPSVPHIEHPNSCSKFLHCVQTPNGSYAYVEKTCGEGTFYHPVRI